MYEDVIYADDLRVYMCFVHVCMYYRTATTKVCSSIVPQSMHLRAIPRELEHVSHSNDHWPMRILISNALNNALNYFVASETRTMAIDLVTFKDFLVL